MTIPTISELRQAIQADLEAQYGSNLSVFGKNFLRALSAVQAAKLWLIYKIAGFIQKNTAPDLADSESKGGTLERWGRIVLNRNPFTPTAGQYSVNVTGTIGAIISAKTVFRSNDNSSNPGKLYILDVEFELESSPDACTLRALETGTAGALEVGDTLAPTVPIANVNSTATVAVQVVEPLDAEDLEEYRDKVVSGLRTEPQGGAATDYRQWALDAQGVRQVYPYTAYGQDNEVDIYVEATAADSTDGRGTPTAAILTSVRDVIEFDPDTTKDLNERGRRPINVIVNLYNVLPRSVDINIASYSGLTAAIQATILSGLTELMADIRPFIAGADVLADRNDRLDVNRIISKIYEVVPGATFGAVTLTVNGVIVTSWIAENGDLPYLRNITYV